MPVKWHNSFNLATVSITALIGLVNLRGSLFLNHPNTETLFNPVFIAKFLMANVPYDDKDTRPQRWSKDSFAALYQLLCQCCNPTQLFDETLYLMWRQVCFKQFNPSKPAKYDLLFQSVNAAQYTYSFLITAYSGKPVGALWVLHYRDRWHCEVNGH